MVLEKVLPSPVAVGTIEEQLLYLRARMSVIDELIRSLEAYGRCSGRVPRKGPGSETADRIVRSLAS